MGRAKTLVLYAAASILTAALLFSLLFLLPRQSAIRRVESLDSQASQLAIALDDTARFAEALPEPDSITPAKPGNVSDYLGSLNSAIASSNTEPLTVPGTIQNRWQSSAIDGYNQVVADNKFEAASNSANGALERTSVLLGYHQVVMQSLRNVIEYNPREDLSVSDAEVLIASIKVAGVGIGRTIEKLESQTFPEDPGLEAIINKLEILQTKRSAYEAAIEDGRPKGDEYEAFVAEVDSAQAAILANRQEFWQPVIEQRVTELKQAYSDFSPYRTALHNLQN